MPTGTSRPGGVGLFWRPSHDDPRLPGHLDWDPVEGATLRLRGHLPTGVDPDDDWRFGTLHAEIDGEPYTLLGCTISSSKSSFGGMHSSESSLIECRSILEGVHVAEPDHDAPFRGVEFRIDEADHWLGRRPIAVDDLSPDRIAISYEADEADTDGVWSISAGYIPDATRGPRSMTVTRQITYGFDAPGLTFGQVLEAIMSVEALASLAVGHPVAAHAVRLGHPSVDHPTSRTTTRPRRVRLHRTPSVRLASRPEAPADPRVLFQLPELGGISALAAWRQRRSSSRIAVGMLLAVQADNLPYLESRLLTNALAIEVIDRLDFPNELMDPGEYAAKQSRMLAAVSDDDHNTLEGLLRHANEPRLSDRLRRLAERADPDRAFLGGVKHGNWADIAARVRNRLTHGADHELVEDERHASVHWLSESIWWIATANMLYAVSPEVASNMLAKHDGAGLREMLPGAVSQLRTYLESTT